MAPPKGQLTRPIIEFLATMVTAMAGRPLTELDVRTICREANITAVGQAELSQVLRELRECLGSTPDSRIMTLLGVVPEQVHLALLTFLQVFVEYRIDLQYQADALAESKLQMTLAETERVKMELRRKERQGEELFLLLEEARQTENALLERIRSLETATAVLKGRLAERTLAVSTSRTRQPDGSNIMETATRTDRNR